MQGEAVPLLAERMLMRPHPLRAGALALRDAAAPGARAIVRAF